MSLSNLGFLLNENEKSRSLRDFNSKAEVKSQKAVSFGVVLGQFLEFAYFREGYFRETGK